VDDHALDLARVEEAVNKLVRLGVDESVVEPIRDWVRDRRAGKPQAVWFFGTLEQPGHYWWESRSGRTKRPRDRSSLDPRGPWGGVDGRLTPRDTQAQSRAALHHLKGWTALALHDYTVDTRGGSNAVFVMDSEVSFERALSYAAEWFPGVVERITAAAPITLAETCLDCEGGSAHARR
jgi:hypothetical protein